MKNLYNRTKTKLGYRWREFWGWVDKNLEIVLRVSTDFLELTIKKKPNKDKKRTDDKE